VHGDHVRGGRSAALLDGRLHLRRPMRSPRGSRTRSKRRPPSWSLRRWRDLRALPARARRRRSPRPVAVGEIEAGRSRGALLVERWPWNLRRVPGDPQNPGDAHRDLRFRDCGREGLRAALQTMRRTRARAGAQKILPPNRDAPRRARGPELEPSSSPPPYRWMPLFAIFSSSCSTSFSSRIATPS
jgi:hypothetical protein